MRQDRGPAPLAGVSATAVGVARLRARESSRPDRLFDDPLAAAFAALPTPQSTVDVGARPAGMAAALSQQVVVRTRFYDDRLLAAADAGCRQVVLLGAGLDARAFRLDWPAGTRVFELDRPEVLDAKAHVLTAVDAAARCDRVAVPVDLVADWAGPLADAGLDQEEPVAWLAEGLLVYLEPVEARRLVDDVTSMSSERSVFLTESGRGAVRLTAAVGEAGSSGVTALWRGGLGVDAADVIAGLGWDVTEHALADLAASYGRPSPGAASGFVVAVRRRSG